MQEKVYSSWVEISAQAMLHNVEIYRKVAPDSNFMAVIKSNAYGHGLLEAVSILKGHTDWYAVNSVTEAMTVYENDPSVPILIMGSSRYIEIPSDLPASIHFVVSSVEEIEKIQSLSPHSPFHLKMDSGMSRLGNRKEGTQQILNYLKERQGLPWSGFMTHFANVEDVTDQSFAQSQLNQFLEMKEAVLDAAGDRKVFFHAAASAAALILPESRLDIIRVGISLYGFWPSSGTRISYKSLTDQIPDFMPVMTWKSRVVHINAVPSGASVGYGCTFRTQTVSKIAVIPVGYYEGYSRSLSNRAYVIIRGKRAMITGRVCMNMIMADVTHIDGVSTGDEVILLGQSEKSGGRSENAGTQNPDTEDINQSETVKAEDLAEWGGTIHYEVTTRILADLPRVVI
jgi:alanine racemase